MGREVRRVPADWQHPKDERGRYLALFDGIDYERRVARWDEEAEKWIAGLRDDYNGAWQPIGDVESKTYADFSGERPNADDYMPRWTDAERTHLMMYETCSEGTPISPAFTTPEELARWLAVTKASAFGDMTATYEQWLYVARGGYACSAIYTPATGLQSGVAGLSEQPILDEPA